MVELVLLAVFLSGGAAGAGVAFLLLRRRYRLRIVAKVDAAELEAAVAIAMKRCVQPHVLVDWPLVYRLLASEGYTLVARHDDEREAHKH